ARVGVSTQDIWTRRALLGRLIRLYEQHLSNAAELESTKARKAQVAREAQAWSRLDEPAPYSIHLTDRLREELQAERLKLLNADSTTARLNQLIDDTRNGLKQAEEKNRQFNEGLEPATDPERKARLAWAR